MLFFSILLAPPAERATIPSVPDPVSRIAVVGAGALGQFYAAQFAHAGHALSLVLRRDLAVVRARGLRVLNTPTVDVQSTREGAELRIPPERLRACASSAEAAGGGAIDWLLVALKATALDTARPLLAPLVTPRTRLVVLCNGLGVEDLLAGWFGAERILGMLCFICVNRDDDGTIRHLAHGHVAVGHHAGDAAQAGALATLCRGAGLVCALPASLLEARWRKLVWNVPFNGLTAVHDCATDRVLADPQLRARARRLMEETIAIAAADLAAHGRSERLEPGWIDEQFRRTGEMGAYLPSTLIDRRAGRPLETGVLIAEPLRRARRLGVPAPELAALAGQLGVVG